jgi:hypothetical protein
MTNNERVVVRLLGSCHGVEPSGVVGEALLAQYKAAVEKLTPEEAERIGRLLHAMGTIWPKKQGS